MTITNYASTRFFDHVLRGREWPMPSQLWLGLHYQDPTLAADPSSEITGLGYERRPVSFSRSGETLSMNGSATFTNLIETRVRYMGVWDSRAGGRLLFYTGGGGGIKVEHGKNFVATSFTYEQTGVRAISAYLLPRLLDHLRGATPAPLGSTPYLALHSGNPGPSGANEISDAGYERIITGFRRADLHPDNASPKVFNGGSSTVSHASVWSAATDGNMLFYGKLSNSRSFKSGEFVVAKGEIVWALSGKIGEVYETGLPETMPTSTRIESNKQFTWNNAPSGTQVGDRLVVIAQRTWDTINSFTAPSGWDELGVNLNVPNWAGSLSTAIGAWTKIATQNDIDNGFIFSFDESGSSTASRSHARVVALPRTHASILNNSVWITGRMSNDDIRVVNPNAGDWVFVLWTATRTSGDSLQNPMFNGSLSMLGTPSGTSASVAWWAEPSQQVTVDMTLEDGSSWPYGIIALGVSP